MSSAANNKRKPPYRRKLKLKESEFLKVQGTHYINFYPNLC